MDAHTEPRTPRRAPKGLLLTNDAAEILGVAPWTIRDYARRGLVSCYRPFGLRGRIAFAEVDLLAFIARSRIEGGARNPGGSPNAILVAAAGR